MMAKRRSGSSAPGARAVRSDSRTQPPIDYSDLPESSREQLTSMKRIGRPTLSAAGARTSIAIRIDPDVLERFKKAAKKRNIGYQTLINDVLAEHAPRS